MRDFLICKHYFTLYGDLLFCTVCLSGVEDGNRGEEGRAYSVDKLLINLCIREGQEKGFHSGPIR